MVGGRTLVAGCAAKLEISPAEDDSERDPFSLIYMMKRAVFEEGEEPPEECRNGVVEVPKVEPVIGIRHNRGGTNLPRPKARCSSDGCTTLANKWGLCSKHGGYRRCSWVGVCDKHAVKGGLCKGHGGGKKCSVPGCNTPANIIGLCGKHGGYYRCAEEGCDKQAKQEGYCKACHRTNELKEEHRLRERGGDL